MDMGKTDKHPLAYKIVDHQMERGTLTPHDLISKFGVEAPKAHQIAGYISNDPYEKRVSKISNILNSNTSQFSYDMGRNKDRMVVNKSTEDGESETRLAILAKGLKAAVTLRGLVKAEKEASKDICPHCGEDRNHKSQIIKGGHCSWGTPHGVVCGTIKNPPPGVSSKQIINPKSSGGGNK